MSGRLRKVEIDNYKCIETLRMAPDERLSFVMGENGSGKSTLLDGLAFLADLVRGGTRLALGGRSRGLLGTDVVGATSLLWRVDRPLGWRLEFDVGKRRYRYELDAISAGEGLRIRGERLSLLGQKGRELLQTDETGSRIWQGDEDGDWQPVTPSFGLPTLLRAQDPLVFPLLVDAWRYLCGIQLLRLDPLQMRLKGPRIAWDDLPDRFGEDFEARVAAMQGERRRDVQPWLDALERRTGWKDIRTVLVGGQDAVEIRESTEDRWLPLALASDGQSVAAYVAMLAQAPPRSVSLLLFDEPALALSRVGHVELQEYLEVLAGAVQVVACTHATEMVDAHNLRAATWVMEREPGRPSQLVPLSRHPIGKEIPGVFPAGATAEMSWKGETWGEE